MRVNGPGGEKEIRVPSSSTITRVSNDCYELAHGSARSLIFAARDGRSVWVGFNGIAAKFELADEEVHDADLIIRAPMTARVVSLHVQPGGKVEKGQVIAVLEAMKMEYKLEAQTAGTVAEIGAAVGELVDLGQMIATLS
ncbi:MAG: acetyl-CoA carboxylase biotin carboxyl carrier protein subunit [Fimbriimonadales bacterium]